MKYLLLFLFGILGVSAPAQFDHGIVGKELLTPADLSIFDTTITSVDDTIFYEQVYKSGKLWDVISVFNEADQEFDPGTIEAGNGTVLSYYPDGTLSARWTYVDGKICGNFQDYYENGSVKYEGFQMTAKVKTVKIKSPKTGKDAAIDVHSTFYVGELRDYCPNGEIRKVRHFNSIGDVIRSKEMQKNGEISFYYRVNDSTDLTVKVLSDSTVEEKISIYYYRDEQALKREEMYTDGIIQLIYLYKLRSGNQAGSVLWRQEFYKDGEFDRVIINDEY